MYQKRKYIIYSLLLLAITTSSCKKWLDVDPSRQIKETNLFDNQQGFIDALFAAYQNAAEPEGYGSNVSLGFLDVLAQRYENKSNQNSDTYGQAARYNYTNVEVNKTTEAIFLKVSLNILVFIFVCTVYNMHQEVDARIRRDTAAFYPIAAVKLS